MKDTKVQYEAPRVVELGKVERLTLTGDHGIGPRDGFTFAGHPIAHHS